MEIQHEQSLVWQKQFPLKSRSVLRYFIISVLLLLPILIISIIGVQKGGIKFMFHRITDRLQLEGTSRGLLVQSIRSNTGVKKQGKRWGRHNYRCRQGSSRVLIAAQVSKLVSVLALNAASVRGNCHISLITVVCRSWSWDIEPHHPTLQCCSQNSAMLLCSPYFKQVKPRDIFTLLFLQHLADVKKGIVY